MGAMLLGQQDGGVKCMILTLCLLCLKDSVTLSGLVNQLPENQAQS